MFFDDRKINKRNFYKNKKLIQIDNVDVDKIPVSKEGPYGKKISFKYFIGYNDNDDIRLLCNRLPQMIGYAKYVHNNKTIFLKIIDKKPLKKYMKICEKTGSLTKKNFDIQPVNGDSDKYIQTKIKSIEIK